MGFPPDDTEKSELFLKLAAREPPSEVVDYPSDDVNEKIRIVGLDTEDIEPLVIKARKKLKQEQDLTEQDLESEFWSIRLSDRTAREILAVSVFWKNPIPNSEATEKGIQYPRTFYSTDQVGKLPPREVGVLWALWNLVQNRINPTENTLDSPEQVRAWVEVLTEGARPFGFFQLELPQQEALLSSLLRWAKCLLSLLGSLPEPLPSSWESVLTNSGFDTGWCSRLAARSTQSTSAPSDEVGDAEVDDDAFSAEEAEARARDMLKMARKLSDDERE